MNASSGSVEKIIERHRQSARVTDGHDLHVWTIGSETPRLFHFRPRLGLNDIPPRPPPWRAKHPAQRKDLRAAKFISTTLPFSFESFGV